MRIEDAMIEFRARYNLSQEKAAKACGITLQTWSNIERGVQTPSKLTMKKIQLALQSYGSRRA